MASHSNWKKPRCYLQFRSYVGFSQLKFMALQNNHKKSYRKVQRLALWKIAWTCTWQLESVHKEAPVLITRIHSQHPVVDILLCTWWLVARGQKTTGRGGEQTGLQPCGLSVVVVTVTITFRYVLKNNPPVSFNIDSSGDLHIISCRRTEVTCRTNPVCGVIGRLSWGCSSVEGKVEGFLFCFGDSFNKIISRLIGKVWILLQEKRVFGYLVSNVIGWVFFIFYAVWEVTFSGAFWGSFGIAVTLAGLLWGVVVGRVLMWRCLRSIWR